MSRYSLRSEMNWLSTKTEHVSPGLSFPPNSLPPPPLSIPLLLRPPLLLFFFFLSLDWFRAAVSPPSFCPLIYDISNGR